MGVFPSAVMQNAGRQPDPYETVGNALKLKQALAMAPGQQQLQQQAVQGGALDIQQKQQQLKDQQAMTQAWKDWAPTSGYDGLAQAVVKNGGSATAAMAIQQHGMGLREQYAKVTTEENNLQKQKNDMMLGKIDQLKDFSDEELPKALGPASQELVQSGLLDPQHAQIVQHLQGQPPADIRKALDHFRKGYEADSAQRAEAIKEREVSAQEMTAQGRKEQGDAALAKNAPMVPPKISFLNKQLQNRYQVLNPGQALPPEYTIQQGATRQDFEDVSTSLEKLESAATARANRIAQQNTAGGARVDARADKSYQFNSGQIEKVAAPVDQAISRISRLQESLAQHNPQADALIAPELLSVMAGGAGSGLRMNEAEISRVIGGRTKWEGLKAELNKWSADPTHAQIPDEQRKQITDLVNAVDGKLKAKQTALDEARQGLINSNDPNEHRQIVAKARGKMTQIDQGQQQSSGGITVQAPNGKTYTFPDQDSADSFKKRAGIK